MPLLASSQEPSLVACLVSYKLLSRKQSLVPRFTTLPLSRATRIARRRRKHLALAKHRGSARLCLKAKVSGSVRHSTTKAAATYNAGPPPPSPSPASANVSCQGTKRLRKNTLLMIFYDFIEKPRKIIDESIKKLITTLYWVMDGTNIGPYLPPPPPSPASVNASCQGANKLRRSIFLMFFYDLYIKTMENIDDPIKN